MLKVNAETRRYRVSVLTVSHKITDLFILSELPVTVAPRFS